MSVFLDAHVHLYPNFSLQSAFDAAWENFSDIAAQNPTQDAPVFVIMLVDAGHLNVFDDLDAGKRKNDLGQWQVSKTNEGNSLKLSNPEKGAIYVIAGRQWVSKEDIEVLSLFDNQKLKSRAMKLPQLVENIVKNEGIPLLTWGVGKWTGSRARVVEEEIDDACLQLLVGDNGNRPSVWSFPELLKKAQNKGIKLISGSDPLTLTDHQYRIGSLGSFSKNLTIDPNNPAAGLKSALLDSDTEFSEFGAKRPMRHFFTEQIRMQINKQLRRFK